MENADRTYDDYLIALYKEVELTAVELAAREGVEVRWLTRAWDRLRREGKVLSMRGRDRGSRVLSPLPDNLDGRPSLYFEDPLLDKLWEAHPEGPRMDLFKSKQRARADDDGRGKEGGGGY